MKETILKTVCHIYYGVYLYTGEAFYSSFHNGKKSYYQGFWGFKLCYVMVFLYTYGTVSLGRYCMGEYAPRFFYHAIVNIIIVSSLSLIIAKTTSLGGEKGLLYFEQFARGSRSCKIKWMIISAFVFIMGVFLFILGGICSPIEWVIWGRF